MNDHLSLSCSEIDEIAAAYGLGAVDASDAAAVEEHLAKCPRPHDEARELIAAASLVPVTLSPVEPSPALRDRLMATVATMPQEHRVATAPPRPEIPGAPSRPWWRLAPLPSALAAIGLAAAVGLGAWGVSLNAQVAERDAALRAVAAADAAYVAEGSAGRGWVFQSGDRALFMADGLAGLEPGQIYELWLIDAEGTAAAAGVLTDTDGVALVTLERALGDATTFAVTVETERVEQSANQPVMVAAIDT